MARPAARMASTVGHSCPGLAHTVQFLFLPGTEVGRSEGTRRLDRGCLLSSSSIPRGRRAPGVRSLLPPSFPLPCHILVHTPELSSWDPTGTFSCCWRAGIWVVGSAGGGEAGGRPGRSPQPPAGWPQGACGAGAGHQAHPVSLPSPHAGAAVSRGETETQVSVGPGQGWTPGWAGGRGHLGNWGPVEDNAFGLCGGRNPKPLREGGCFFAPWLGVQSSRHLVKVLDENGVIWCLPPRRGAETIAGGTVGRPHPFVQCGQGRLSVRGGWGAKGGRGTGGRGRQGREREAQRSSPPAPRPPLRAACGGVLPALDVRHP